MTRTKTSHAPASAENGSVGRSPDWVVKAPKISGQNPGLERIGVAWDRADGGICVRLTGRQIVSGDLYIYPSIEGAP